jgi:hypothetical protein
MAANPPLIGLLGAHWLFGARAVGAAWSGDGSMAGFGLADGTAVLARAEWQGGPQVRRRAGGSVEATPPADPSPPVTRLRIHEEGCLALIADTEGGFLTGGADGKLMRLGRDGKTNPLPASPGRPVNLVASGHGGWRAAASDRHILVLGPARAGFDTPETVTALSFDPAGQFLAAAHGAGVVLYSVADGAAWPVPLPSPATSLAWRPDGAWLALGCEDGLFAMSMAPLARPASERGQGNELPSPVPLREGAGQKTPRMLAFTADGTLLAASGGERARCWRFDSAGPADASPVECGIRNRISPVCALAPHPHRSLLAVGHENGAVLLCQPGSLDALFVKNWGGGAVTVLAWSPDGHHLALGTAEGQAGLLLLPPELLRAGQAPANTEFAG